MRKDIEAYIKQVATENLVEVVRDYTELERCGGGNWKGLCPFPHHTDHNATNFVVSEPKGISSCFACGKIGLDAVGFIREVQDVGYVDALKILADKFHIDTGEEVPIYEVKPKPKVAEKKVFGFIPDDAVRKYESNDNVLMRYLKTLFDEAKVNDVVRLYRTGTKGMKTIFWQIDYDGNVRYGKVMEYKPDGHRNKESQKPFEAIHYDLIRERLLPKEWKYEQCLFGEHLLSLPENIGKPVAIVESEKTAMIGTIARKKYVWLATCGKGYLSEDIVAHLAGRKVLVFTDADGYEDWKKVVSRLQMKPEYRGFHCLNAKDLTEDPILKANPKLDIADILLDEVQKRKAREEMKLTTNRLDTMPKAVQDMAKENPNLIKLINVFNLEAV